MLKAELPLSDDRCVMPRCQSAFTQQYARCLVASFYGLFLLQFFCLTAPLLLATNQQRPHIAQAVIALRSEQDFGLLVVLILLIAVSGFAANEHRRRKQTEAINLELTNVIMERRQVGERLKKRNEELEIQVVQCSTQLEAAVKDSESFSYAVAHDLRAPLRHISGFSKILQDNYSAVLDATAQGYLRFLCDGANHMGQLIDDLLMMAQIGRQEIVPSPTDLNLLVEATLESLQPECTGRQVDWKIQQLPSLECDPALMKQVFRNLLSNAVKYSRPREKAVIEVGCLATDGEVAIFIRDNGAGFDQRYAHKLFGVFQRLHTAEEFEGTGVGLATVHSIVQRHGGRVWAEAEVNMGATFFFTLPASRGVSLDGKQVSAKVNHGTR